MKRSVVQRLSAQYRATKADRASVSVAEAFYGSSPAFVEQDRGGGNVSHHHGNYMCIVAAIRSTDATRIVAVKTAPIRINRARSVPVRPAALEDITNLGEAMSARRRHSAAPAAAPVSVTSRRENHPPSTDEDGLVKHV